ncbi:uncharacterized protein LOC144687998 [Cetorhinus maximus]
MNSNRVSQPLLTLANLKADVLRRRLVNMNILILIWMQMSIFCPDWTLSAAEGIRVYQTPDSLLVTEGGTANLTCVYSADEIQDFVINWLHQPKNQNNQTYIIYMDRCRRNQSIRVVNRKDQDRNVSQILISRLQPGDSGTYYCELMSLNPPSTEGMRGNGSTLTVTESFKDPDSWKVKVLWPLLLCLLVILCVIFLVAARNRKARQKQSVEHSVLFTGTVPEA